eukprot:2906542-Amphidinium_carterae.1
MTSTSWISNSNQRRTLCSFLHQATSHILGLGSNPHYLRIGRSFANWCIDWRSLTAMLHGSELLLRAST